MNTHFSATTMLRTVPLFSSLTEEHLARLAPMVQHRSYPKRAYILRAGDNAEALYVLMSGRANVLLDDGDGREVIISVIGPSEFFGEMSLIDGKPRSATIQALDNCQVLCIPRSAFAECMRIDSASRLMLQTVVSRLRAADRKIETLALMDVYGRVACVLLENSREIDGQWIVEPGSEQIAKIVAASREMVSRVLKDLRKKGIIGGHKRKIILLDRAAVAQRASGRVAPAPLKAA
jgi:CRP/FNR family cyclic AMP-dependent transcriptional regulator